MANKILVTGVAGFLGSYLADELLKKGHEVVGVDNLLGGYKDNIPAGVEFYEKDCLDFESMSNISKKCEIIYHAACTAYEGLSVFSPNLVTSNTFGATVSVLTAGIANGMERFIYCSSMARYGTQDITPFTEDMLPKPQDPYGIAKYASELMVKELAVTHNFEYVIAVPHNIIGPRQKYDDPFRNVASIMINLMLQGRQPYIYGSGQQQRCFSFINDVVDPLLKMGFQANLSGETINIGPDDQTITINDLALTIGKILNFDVKPIYVSDRPREVKVATCSAVKAREFLQYETKSTLEEGLQEMISYIQKRGPRDFDYHLPIEINSPTLPRTWKNRLF